MTPSLSSINLPGWAHKAQENTLLTFTGLLIKDITDHTDEQSDRRDALARHVGRAGEPRALCGSATLQACVQLSGRSLNPVLLVFYGGLRMQV